MKEDVREWFRLLGKLLLWIIIGWLYKIWSFVGYVNCEFVHQKCHKHLPEKHPLGVCLKCGRSHAMFSYEY